MATQVIFLTAGSTTWTVPSDWNNSNNTIDLIGAGGGGHSSTGAAGAGGGGGGAFARLTNFALTPGATVYVSVPGITSADTNGANTWLNKVSNAQPTAVANGALAVGGSAGTTSGSSTGGSGAGGAAASSIGKIGRAHV